MIIKKKRIVSIQNYLSGINQGDEFYIGLENAAEYINLEKYGFVNSSKSSIFVPKPLSKVATYNLEGSWNLLKDLPKEIRTIEHDYHIVDWNGNDHYGTCYQDKLCYQRSFNEPPNIEFMYDGKRLISQNFKNEESNYRTIKHVVNLLLEISGSCTIFNESSELELRNVKQVEWTILPKGNCPWEKIEDYITKTTGQKSKSVQKVVLDRMDFISKFDYDSCILGKDSFYGYVGFVFEKKNVNIFESNAIDNATYVFSNDWEVLSKLTKAEIIYQNLYKHRILHNREWKGNLSKIMND